MTLRDGRGGTVVHICDSVFPTETLEDFTALIFNFLQLRDTRIKLCRYTTGFFSSLPYNLSSSSSSSHSLDTLSRMLFLFAFPRLPCCSAGAGGSWQSPPPTNPLHRFISTVRSYSYLSTILHRHSHIHTYTAVLIWHLPHYKHYKHYFFFLFWFIKGVKNTPGSTKYGEISDIWSVFVIAIITFSSCTFFVWH